MFLTIYEIYAIGFIWLGTLNNYAFAVDAMALCRKYIVTALGRFKCMLSCLAGTDGTAFILSKVFTQMLPT